MKDWYHLFAVIVAGHPCFCDDLFKVPSWSARDLLRIPSITSVQSIQFVICFKETIGFDVKVSFASRPRSRLIRWYSERILRKGYSVPQGTWKLQTEYPPVVNIKDNCDEVLDGGASEASGRELCEIAKNDWKNQMTDHLKYFPSIMNWFLL